MRDLPEQFFFQPDKLQRVGLYGLELGQNPFQFLDAARCHVDHRKPHHFRLQNAAHDEVIQRAGFRRQLPEGRALAGIRPVSHETAAARAALDNAPRLQNVQRLAHGVARHPELGRKRAF